MQKLEDNEKKRSTCRKFIEMELFLQKSDLKIMFSCLLFSYNDECDGYYYFNTKTKVRQWEHPLDADYKKLVEKSRKSAATGINDLSDVIL